MLNRLSVTLAAGTAALLCASGTFAQLPNPYGSSITIESAKKAAAPAVAEAQKNNWRMAVAIVDISGDLVFFEKMDGTQAASVNIAVDKARSAARFKRPTKALQDALAAGGEGLRLLATTAKGRACPTPSRTGACRESRPSAQGCGPRRARVRRR